MSKENKTEINWGYLIFSIVCFVNMYWAFTGKWGLRPQEEPEALLGVICLILGVSSLFASFSNESK
jgi:hypothetical protein